jgi:hypothetical protein
VYRHRHLLKQRPQCQGLLNRRAKDPLRWTAHWGLALGEAALVLTARITWGI